MRLFKCEKGSVIVELGLLVPLLAAITYGFIMFTNVVRTDIILQVAAREGAREYSVSNSSNKAINAAKLQIEMGEIDVDSVTITPKSKDKERIVAVNKTMTFYIPFAGPYNIELQKGAVFYDDHE